MSSVPLTSMPRNNLAALTQSHNAIAAKKKAKREQIKEILFDDDARRCSTSQFLVNSAHLHFQRIFDWFFTSENSQRRKRQGTRQRRERNRSVWRHVVRYVLTQRLRKNSVSKCSQQRRMLREQAAENSAQVEKAYGAVLGVTPRAL
jgi:ribosomal RNA-processing protein 17